MENANLRKQLNYYTGSTTAPTKKEEAYRKEAYNAMVDTFYQMLPRLKFRLDWDNISLPNAADKDWMLPNALRHYCVFARKYMARSDKLKNSKYEM